MEYNARDSPAHSCWLWQRLEHRGVSAQICNGWQEWCILAVKGGVGATVRSVPCFVPLISPFVRGKVISGIGDFG